jgi:hypothetical protein
VPELSNRFTLLKRASLPISLFLCDCWTDRTLTQECLAIRCLCSCSRTMSSRNLIISAVSNFSTAYNLIIINIVHVVIEYQYCGGDHCGTAAETASTACLAGAIIGQLIFGYIGDCLGRPLALQLTMGMSILGALASAFAVRIGPSHYSLTLLLFDTLNLHHVKP